MGIQDRPRYVPSDIQCMLNRLKAERRETHQSCQNEVLYDGCFRTLWLATPPYGILHHLGAGKVATHLMLA